MNAFYRPFLTTDMATRKQKLIHQPTVEVRVAAARSSLIYQGRLDTGADDTVLPWSDIDTLGVQLLPGSGLELKGLGGSERVMFGLVDLEITAPDGPIRWSHLAAFSPSNLTLFGLNGFLEYFVVRLDGVKHEIKLQHRGKSPAPRFLPPLPRRSR
jgi:hypothetical protein